jgi:hypothetical protein
MEYHPMPHGTQGANDCAIVSIANYFNIPYENVMARAKAYDKDTCTGKRGTSLPVILNVTRDILIERNPTLIRESIKWIKWAPRPARSVLASFKFKVITKSGLLVTYHGKRHHLQMVKDNVIIGTRGEIETLQDIRAKGNHVRAFLEC